MDETMFWQVIERPSGTGAVYDDHGELATVAYQLVVEQSISPPAAADGDAPDPGASRLSGTVKVVSGRRKLVDRGTLTLHLRDQRCLDFTVSEGPPAVASDSLEIVPIGPLRLVGGARRPLS